MEKLIEFLGSWIDEDVHSKDAHEIKKVQNIKIDGTLYQKVLSALKEKARGKKIIKTSDLNHLLSWMFHLNKKESRLLMKELESLGFIEIVPYKGIRLRY